MPIDEREGVHRPRDHQVDSEGMDVRPRAERHHVPGAGVDDDLENDPVDVAAVEPEDDAVAEGVDAHEREEPGRDREGHPPSPEGERGRERDDACEDQVQHDRVREEREEDAEPSGEGRPFAHASEAPPAGEHRDGDREREDMRERRDVPRHAAFGRERAPEIWDRAHECERPLRRSTSDPARARERTGRRVAGTGIGADLGPHLDTDVAFAFGRAVIGSASVVRRHFGPIPFRSVPRVTTTSLTGRRRAINGPESRTDTRELAVR